MAARDGVEKKRGVQEENRGERRAAGGCVRE